MHPEPLRSAEPTLADPVVAGFECKLDSGTFASCTSPYSYQNLSDGSHTFTVQAKDAAGNLDQSPATYTWTIDTQPPDTQILTKPALFEQ